MKPSRKPRNTFDSFRDLVKLACSKLYPGIGYYDRVVYARVVGTFNSSGRVTEGSKLWSVDLEILGPDLQPDLSRAPIKDVPVDPIELSTDGRALFPVLFEGTIVRLGWMYADRSLPYIVSVTAEGQRLPSGSSGQMSVILGDALEILARLRDSAAGPVSMKPQDYAALMRLIASLPGSSL